MSPSYRICKRCLEQLRLSEEGQEDVATFLLAVGAHGIEVVPESQCQAGLSDHSGTSLTAEEKRRTLADATPAQLEAATANLVRQLHLTSSSPDGVALAAAIKEAWEKARTREA